MSFGSRASSSTRRLVNHFSDGYSITIFGAAAPAAFDPSTRTLTASSSSMTLVCTRPTPFGKALVDGERIQVNDLRVLVRKGDPARTFEIAPDQLATVQYHGVASKTYRIVAAPDDAGGDEIQLRGNP